MSSFATYCHLIATSISYCTILLNITQSSTPQQEHRLRHMTSLRCMLNAHYVDLLSLTRSRYGPCLASCTKLLALDCPWLSFLRWKSIYIPGSVCFFKNRGHQIDVKKSTCKDTAEWAVARTTTLTCDWRILWCTATWTLPGTNCSTPVHQEWVYLQNGAYEKIADGLYCFTVLYKYLW